MTLRDDETGFEIMLGYDDDNFPVVNIDTGGGFYAEHQRPTVLVNLNGQTVHEMFNDKDRRWADEKHVLAGEERDEFLICKTEGEYAPRLWRGGNWSECVNRIWAQAVSETPDLDPALLAVLNEDAYLEAGGVVWYIVSPDEWES